jgi:hypothetical protein
MDAQVDGESDTEAAAVPGSVHMELPRGRIWIEDQVDAAVTVGTALAGGHRVAGGGHPPPAPTEVANLNSGPSSFPIGKRIIRHRCLRITLKAALSEQVCSMVKTVLA